MIPGDRDERNKERARTAWLCSCMTIPGLAHQSNFLVPYHINIIQTTLALQSFPGRWAVSFFPFKFASLSNDSIIPCRLFLSGRRRQDGRDEFFGITVSSLIGTGNLKEVISDHFETSHGTCTRGYARGERGGEQRRTEATYEVYDADDWVWLFSIQDVQDKSFSNLVFVPCSYFAWSHTLLRNVDKMTTCNCNKGMIIETKLVVRGCAKWNKVYNQ